MHEMFLAGQIAEELVRLTEPHQPCRLARVVLKVGSLRQVVPDLLHTALAAATKGTAAESAEMVIEPVEARGRCLSCGHEFTVERWSYLCPKCESGNVASEGGDDLIIETITLEKEEHGVELPA